MNKNPIKILIDLFSYYQWFVLPQIEAPLYEELKMCIC